MKWFVKAITAVQLATILLLIHQADAHSYATFKDPHYSEGRTTMVHLFEWKFSDIALECERFLGPMGYAGVQVSPINENLIIENRPWFERYQPMSYKIISRSGNEQELKDMVKRCNAVGVRIYVDAVINHMTGDQSPAIGTGGSQAITGQLKYPAVPYGPSDFHSPCTINNYSDPVNVRDCELSGLHDLDQHRAHVRSKIVGYLNRVLAAGVAGFRIDGAKHMWPSDLDAIYRRLSYVRIPGSRFKSRPFIYQEVIDLGSEGVSKQEYTNNAVVIEFVFGIVLGMVFRGTEHLDTLANWGYPHRGLLPSDDAVVMVDNHDNQRGHGAGGESILSYKDGKIYKMALAFMLAHPYGMPRVISSFAFTDPSQGPPADGRGNIISPRPASTNTSTGEVTGCDYGWVCEHRWRQVFGMVGFRNTVKNSELANWWSNGLDQIAFSRGSLGFVAFNNQKLDLAQNLTTGMPAGSYCDVISGRRNSQGNGCTGRIIHVGDDGKAYIEIGQNDEEGVIAIHINSKISQNNFTHFSVDKLKKIVELAL